MKIEDTLPAHCYSRAGRLLGAVGHIRDELGRAEDTRVLPEVAGAQPRECYFEALVAFRKAERLASEVGAGAVRSLPLPPALGEIRPGHVLQVLDAVGAVLGDIRTRLEIVETSSDPAIEPSRQPSDVLKSIVKINRELSRCLERPFTPSDVYEVVALASAYASRLGADVEPAPFERRKKPLNCYQTLESCLASAATHVGKRGGPALLARGTPTDVLPGDVYDLANLVLCEVAFLHSLTSTTLAVHPFLPAAASQRLPSHVFQLARTLEKQLSSLK